MPAGVVVGFIAQSASEVRFAVPQTNVLGSSRPHMRLDWSEYLVRGLRTDDMTRDPSNP